MARKLLIGSLGISGLSLAVIALLSLQQGSGTSQSAAPVKTNEIPVVKLTSGPSSANKKSSDVVSHELRSGSEEPYVASTPTVLPKAFAPSLQDTEIDGRLKVDAMGHLVVDLEVKNFFDYFLNTVGEVTPDVAVAEMQQLAASHLPPTAVNQAMQLLGEYLAYKELAVQLMAQPMIPKEQQTKEYQVEMLENTFQTLKAIRRQAMSEEAVTAFFSLEEAYGEYTLATIKAQNDDSLSASEKRALVAYHREQLPPLIRKTEERVTADAQKHQTIHQVITAGNEDELRQQLVDNDYSADAVEEIVAHQNQQRAFDQRYQQYLLDRRQLISSGLSDQDQAYQLNMLRARYFTNEKELTQAKVRDLNS